MSGTMFFILLGALLLVVVGISMLQQHKQKLERARRQEIAKHKAMVNELEQLLAILPHLPFSNALTILLQNRLLESLVQLCKVDPNNQTMTTRRNEVRRIIISLEDSPPTERTIDGFNVPQTEKQIVAVIKSVKRMKDFITQEQRRGSINQEQALNEQRRCEQLLLRVNVSVTMERARLAIMNHQSGSARQLLTQLHQLLENQKVDDQYVSSHKEKVQEMLNELNQRQQDTLQEHVEERLEQEGDDLDELFSPKKKW